MRILILNTVYAIGSTGKIVKQIAEKAENRGHNCMVAHRYNTPDVAYPDNVVEVSSWLDCHIHNRISRLTMLRGCFSKIKTMFFLNKIKRFNPDLIHLHNIHGNFINLSMLFRFIKRNKIKVIWTFHDSWSLTGNCKYFDLVNCDKWKTLCRDCPQKNLSMWDISSFMHKRKKKMFCDVDSMIIVTPSLWLANLVSESYLAEYQVRVINNGIDLSVFTPVVSNFKEEKGIADKYIVLGVAYEWERRKGLDVFIELSKRLSDNYRIVLVGTNDEVDLLLPKEVISIHKTNNQHELASIYSASDVFVNPTREDNYPTVNMEALACGTPVVTFKTGGCAEIIDESCGFSVDINDVDTMAQRIIDICENKAISRENCLKKAKTHNKNDKFDEYVMLYEEFQ